ncbi:GntR family transcriptional regulator [Paenibacillus mendelii]|uniref:GntR family transcriptional regulator n=1 Tax=Paenibacillus mendelii TaxID=206163 RepID=A0ABV6J3U3_9BACL|nr:GntR family transcriptional regulator [Paenibacillus mendelii]MCQ6562005.1 GntR family transcriptional regulator [Paenibacillus mendelii]
MNENKPLYSQIQDHIIQKIESGSWPEQHQIPPERHIAEQFNVSRITAKNAVLGLVNEGLLYRHRGKGTFVAASASSKRIVEDKVQAPRPAVRSGNKIIGFITPWMESQYSSQLLSGVEHALSEQSYHVLYKRIADREAESGAIHTFLDIPVDGMIIVASQGEQHFNDDIVRLVLNKHHVVLVEKTMRDIRTNGVYCNTKEIGNLMVDYLCKLKAKHIGLITYPSLYTIGISDRIQSFQTALLSKGMEQLSDQHILSVSSSILEQTSQDEIPPDIVAFIENNTAFDAIATVDALLAQYVGRACAMLNRTGIKIICCDQPSLHQDCINPTAYIDQSPFQMGIVAAQMMIDSIENQSEPRKHMISPRLIEI